MLNPTPDEIRDLLRQAHTVAVVGLSDKPDRDSYRVAAYLRQHGYRIIPVNPGVTVVLGERAYPSLRDVPERIDLVDVFRRSDAVPDVVDAAIDVGAKAVWLQEGVVHHAAADKARAAGLVVVMDRCVLKEHARLPAG
jgi:predicted CoA-binding protein